jgi:hypothetical protein
MKEEGNLIFGTLFVLVATIAEEMMQKASLEKQNVRVKQMPKIAGCGFESSALQQQSVGPEQLLEIQRALGNGSVQRMLALSKAGQRNNATINAYQQALRVRRMPRKFPLCKEQAPIGSPFRDVGMLHAKMITEAVYDTVKQEVDHMPEQGPPAQHGTHRASGNRIQCATGHLTSMIDEARVNDDILLSNSGTSYEPTLSGEMEQRLEHGVSRVRIHTDAQAAPPVPALNTHANTVGRNIAFTEEQIKIHAGTGQRLPAHELAHVAQQASSTVNSRTLQRQVVLRGMAMQTKDRAAFLKTRHWASRRVAKSVMEDMAAAGDTFDFVNEGELEAEITKRASTTEHMKQTQETIEKVPGDKRSAFGYPFTSPSALYGPRVNYAARDYWEPAPSDGYVIRKDKAKNDALNKLERHLRCTVYGDQCGDYAFKLTAIGKADPYHAIAYLFSKQPPHKRTLIHCDYLLSLVNFMSFADAVGTTEFNKRIVAYGVGKISLRWNAFNDLQTEFFEAVRSGGKTISVKRSGLGSLQRIAPTSEQDFVIGDHVVFFNHLAYDLINREKGNAWRLENAVLIGKDPKGHDVFLGHGSGRKTEAEMRAKLAEEFNYVAKIALALVAKTKSKDAKVQSQARTDLAAKFPLLHEIGGEWRIRGKAELCDTKSVNEKLRMIKPNEVIGPRDPCDTTKMFPVQRPAESAK